MAIKEDMELNEDVEQFYYNMISQYFEPKMIIYIKSEHKIDFIRNCTYTINKLKEMGINKDVLNSEDNNEIIDIFYETIYNNLKFFSWNTQSNRVIQDEPTRLCINFIKNKL